MKNFKSNKPLVAHDDNKHSSKRRVNLDLSTLFVVDDNRVDNQVILSAILRNDLAAYISAFGSRHYDKLVSLLQANGIVLGNKAISKMLDDSGVNATLLQGYVMYLLCEHMVENLAQGHFPLIKTWPLGDDSTMIIASVQNLGFSLVTTSKYIWSKDVIALANKFVSLIANPSVVSIRDRKRELPSKDKYIKWVNTLFSFLKNEATPSAETMRKALVAWGTGPKDWSLI